MVTPLDIAIELSDLFEVTGYEGTSVAEMFDTDILPLLKTPLWESDVIGIGDRFAKAIDLVQNKLNQVGGDRIQTLKDMMKSALVAFVKQTHDALTGRKIFSIAIRSGADTMLTVTGATLVANALGSHHPEQAQSLLQGVARKLSGAQPMASHEEGAQPVTENASGAAVSAGAIATVATGDKKRKQILRRRDSIFAENALSWNDVQDLADTMSIMEAVVQENKDRQYDGIIIDPMTAELVLSVHNSLTPINQYRYEAKPIREIIDIAFRAVQRGLIEVTLE